MHPIGRRLYGIGQFARHDVALEVARTVEHVARSLDKRVRYCIVGLHLLSAQPAFGTHTLHQTVYKHQSGHLKRHVGTILIRVELGTCTVGTVSCLPLVRTLQIDRQLLAATESVASHYAHDRSRTHTARCLAHHICLYREVVRLVEDTVEREVERIASCRGVARGESEVNTRENSLRSERIDRLLVGVIAVELARSHLQVARYHTRTDRRALACIYYCVVATCHGVGELLHHVAPHLKIYVADIPLSAYLRGQTVGIL